MRQPIRALAGAVLALLVASPAWGAKALKDVRIGKHETFTRIVFELDQPAGYKYERNEPTPGIWELVVSLEASGPEGEIDVPESLIDAVRLQTDGKRTVVNIRLNKAGLRIKEMTLREPPRIVLDVIDDNAAAAPVAVKPKPAPKVVAEAAPVPTVKAKVEAKPSASKPEPKPATSPKVAAKTTPAPKPKVAPVPRPARASEPKAEVAPKPEPKPQADVAPKAIDSPRKLAGSLVNGGAEPIDLAAERPSDPTAPTADSERAVPAAPGASFPGTGGSAADNDSGGLFTPTNLTLALVGGVVLVAGSYLLARRRRDDGDFEDFEDDELGDDNPFAGLESAAPETDDGQALFEGEPIAEAIVVPEETPDSTRQADLFAGPPAAEQSSPASQPAGSIKTEGSDMSMDGTMDFSAASEAVTNLGSDAAVGGDSEGIMRMIRELATRVGDLETRLEDAVDSKERLERQVAAQTEELRVQRAAIARTQRAVRNMSQPIEDTPTEPAPRTPRPE